ncbi:DMT family transporter [Desulfocurvibacter africanus]|nr:DMT family transporter [Desulfocurvibacter africanus]
MSRKRRARRFISRGHSRMVHQGSHLPGISLAAAAAAIWGVSFVIPSLLMEWSPLEITLSRYFVYGLVSSVVFLRYRKQFAPLTRREWLRAASLAFTGFFMAYLLLTASIQEIGPAVPTLLMGATPVCVALFGNLIRREFPFTRLMPPLSVIFIGLLVVNLDRYGLSVESGTVAAGRVGGMALGLLEALASLAVLTWYFVDNLVFLRSHPHISPVQWSCALGLLLGLMSLTCLPLALLAGSGIEIAGRALLPFVMASLVLGIGSSWLGGILWNRACGLLPGSLAGQMIVFWPISGLVLTYLVESRLPTPAEALGAAMALGGVFLGVRATSRPVAVRHEPA